MLLTQVSEINNIMFIHEFEDIVIHSLDQISIIDLPKVPAIHRSRSDQEDTSHILTAK